MWFVLLSYSGGFWCFDVGWTAGWFGDFFVCLPCVKWNFDWLIVYLWWFGWVGRFCSLLWFFPATGWWLVLVFSCLTLVGVWCLVCMLVIVFDFSRFALRLCFGV